MDLHIGNNTGEEEPDWKKVERDMTKVGLKNGLSDGRDSNFQRSFDMGYKDGFDNGFSLGKLKFQGSNNKTLMATETAQHLENTSAGMCVMCSTEKENENVAVVRTKQSELVASNITKVNQDLNRHL